MIMDKTDVKDALNKFEELTKEELLVTAAHTNAIVRESNAIVRGSESAFLLQVSAS